MDAIIDLLLGVELDLFVGDNDDFCKEF